MFPSNAKKIGKYSYSSFQTVFLYDVHELYDKCVSQRWRVHVEEAGDGEWDLFTSVLLCDSCSRRCFVTWKKRKKEFLWKMHKKDMWRKTLLLERSHGTNYIKISTCLSNMRYGKKIKPHNRHDNQHSSWILFRTMWQVGIHTGVLLH